MNDQAKRELKRDAIANAFLLMAPDLTRHKPTMGIIRGPIFHDGRVYDVEMNILVKESN